MQLWVNDIKVHHEAAYSRARQDGLLGSHAACTADCPETPVHEHVSPGYSGSDAFSHRQHINTMHKHSGSQVCLLLPQMLVRQRLQEHLMHDTLPTITKHCLAVFLSCLQQIALNAGQACSGELCNSKAAC